MKDTCPTCKQELTGKSINDSYGTGNDTEGNTWHLDPCYYERNEKEDSRDIT